MDGGSGEERNETMRSVSFTNFTKVHDDGAEQGVGDRSMLVMLRRHSCNMQLKDRQASLEFLDDNTDLNPSGRCVKFGNVFIREYERVLGDSPCSTGPPIGLGWKYWAFEPSRTKNSDNNETEGVIPLDEYERMNSPKLPAKKLLLSRGEREELLIESGFARRELAEAVRQNIKLKNQRRQTVTNLNFEPYEVVLEQCAKKLKKVVTISVEKRKKVSSRHLYEKWVADESLTSRSSVGQELSPMKGILKKSS